LWFSFADLCRIIAFASGIASRRKRKQLKSKVVSEITPSRTVPGSCSGCPHTGGMMFQFEQAGNGEGLEDRVFICTPNSLSRLVLLTTNEGM